MLSIDYDHFKQQSVLLKPQCCSSTYDWHGYIEFTMSYKIGLSKERKNRLIKNSYLFCMASHMTEHLSTIFCFTSISSIKTRFYLSRLMIVFFTHELNSDLMRRATKNMKWKKKRLKIWKIMGSARYEHRLANLHNIYNPITCPMIIYSLSWMYSFFLLLLLLFLYNNEQQVRFSETHHRISETLATIVE